LEKIGEHVNVLKQMAYEICTEVDSQTKEIDDLGTKFEKNIHTLQWRSRDIDKLL